MVGFRKSGHIYTLLCSYVCIMYVYMYVYMYVCMYVGANGQSGQIFNVTITTSPDTLTYTVGDSVMFICTVDPPITSTTVNVSYLWQCDGCFADGRTEMAFERILTDMDSSSMINCRVTIDNDTFTTDTPFDLQVTQGIVIYNK